MKLPQYLENEIREKIASGTYTSPEEVLRKALDALDCMEGAEQELEQALLDGLTSGSDEDMAPADWEEVRQAGRARIKAKQGE